MNNIKYYRDGRAPIPEKEVTSKIMSSIKGKDTKPEMVVRKNLWALGIRGYRLHWKKAPGKPDIAFPGKKLAIFINGCFWHRCPFCNIHIPKSHTDYWKNKFTQNVLRDMKHIEELSINGWGYFILWECQINNEIDRSINETVKFINTSNATSEYVCTGVLDEL